MIVKPYPKDDESPVRTLSQQLLDVAARIQALGLNRDDLLFPSPEASGGNLRAATPFRTRVWLPGSTPRHKCRSGSPDLKSVTSLRRKAPQRHRGFGCGSGCRELPTQSRHGRASVRALPLPSKNPRWCNAWVPGQDAGEHARLGGDPTG